MLADFPTDWETALAIAAHPDDLEYGAAAAIAAWTRAGKKVSYLLVTRGEAGIDGLAPAESAPVREAEQQAAAACVGVTDVEFLDHADGVIEYGLALRRDLAAAIRRHRPELIVTGNFAERWPQGGWNSPDHRATGRAAVDAVGAAGNRWIFPDLVDAGYEPWGGVRHVAVAGSPNPTHAVDVSDTLEAAIESLQAHRAYLEGLGGAHPMADARAFLTMAAETSGRDFEGRPAAVFELLY